VSITLANLHKLLNFLRNFFQHLVNQKNSYNFLKPSH